jgi:hypothetical protein
VNITQRRADSGVSVIEWALIAMLFTLAACAVGIYIANGPGGLSPKDRAAQRSLDSALAAVRTYQQNSPSLAGLSPAQLALLDIHDGFAVESDGPGTVAVGQLAGGSVTLAAQGLGTNCWYARYAAPLRYTAYHGKATAVTGYRPAQTAYGVTANVLNIECIADQTPPVSGWEASWPPPTN